MKEQYVNRETNWVRAQRKRNISCQVIFKELRDSRLPNVGESIIINMMLDTIDITKPQLKKIVNNCEESFPTNIVKQWYG